MPSPNHGTIACLVATFLCWVGLSGAKLIRKNFLLKISDYGHPTERGREREGVEGNGNLRENRGVYIVSLLCFV